MIRATPWRISTSSRVPARRSRHGPNSPPPLRGADAGVAGAAPLPIVPGENSVEPAGAGDAGGRDFGELGAVPLEGVRGLDEVRATRDGGLAKRTGTGARTGLARFATTRA